MKRYACHRLYTSPDKFLKNPAVVLDEQGRVVDYHPLQEETASTEWIGGIIFLSTRTDILPQRDLHELLLANMPPHEGETAPYAWHISHLDFTNGSLTPQSILRRLSHDSVITL